MRDALDLWRLMGRRMDWGALEVVARLYECEVSDEVIERLLLLQAHST